MRESDFKVEISFEALTMTERISKGRSVMFVKRVVSSLQIVSTMHDSPSCLIA